jgi:transketolase
MENHSVIGGLGSIIAERMAEEGMGKKLRRIGIRDTFVHGASKQYLMKEYGLDAMALIGEVEKTLDARFDIKESDLKEAFVAAVHSNAKAEAL